MKHWDVKEHYLASMSPQGLVLELLGKMELCLRRASDALAEKRLEEAHNQLILAQGICVKLRDAMSFHDSQSQLAHQFWDLLSEQLCHANMIKSKEQTDQVLEWVRRLQSNYAYRLGRLS